MNNPRIELALGLAKFASAAKQADISASDAAAMIVKFFGTPDDVARIVADTYREMAQHKTKSNH